MVESTFALSDMVAGLADTFGREAWMQGAELVVDVSPSLAALTQRLSGDMPQLVRRVQLLGQQALQPAAPQSSLILRIEQPPAPPAPAAAHGEDAIVLRFGFHDPARRAQVNGGHFFDERFPRSAPAGAAPLLPSLEAALRPLRQHQILAVDDNGPALRVLLQAGSALGLTIEPAQDAWDALRAVMLAHEGRRSFGLVLLEARMPGMNALDCARQLRETTPCRAPIVLMAGPGDDDAVAVLAPDQPLGRALGIGGILRKPVVEGAVLARACLQAWPAQPRVVAPEPPAPGALAGQRLLVVAADDAGGADAADLAHRLQHAGASTRVTVGHSQALDRLAMPQCDAVLLHLPRPAHQALEAARAVRAEPRLCHLPLLAVGPAAARLDSAALAAAGIDEVLVQVDDPQRLADALRRCRAAREVAVPTVPPSLDQLPGVDAAVGRASTMGNDKLYRRLLIKFRDAQHDVPERIAAAWRAGDVQGARRLAHDLASVSGTLGAMQLHLAARRLESVCAGEADAAGLPAALAEAGGELSAVLRSLHVLGTE